MQKKSISVTETELSILEEIWKESPRTIRQITDSIYENGTTSEYATVQKLLDRLEGKGCVSRIKQGNVNTFSAKMSRSELIGSGLEGLAEKLCSGSLTPLLVHLTGKVKLSKADRELLKDLIDEA